MAKVLHQIDSNHFNSGFQSKIKTDVPPDNKHLKVNNLRKILGAIVEFNDEMPFVSLAEFPLPNVNLAAEGQPEEIGTIIKYGWDARIQCGSYRGLAFLQCKNLNFPYYYRVLQCKTLNLIEDED